MDRSCPPFLLTIALLLYGTAASMTALAGPPLLQRLQSTHAPVARPLDLRAPSSFEPAVPRGAALLGGMHRFPGSTSGTELRASDESSLSLPAVTRPARIPGNLEAFAQRFRREGLPVARLWENHAALVSFGLNSKGKPGIWLIQKTR